MRHRPTKALPMPQCPIGSPLSIGDEGEGVVLATTRSHILCAVICGSPESPEILGYQIMRWDTRKAPTWQCIYNGWHLHRTSADRHLARIAAAEKKTARKF